MHKKRLGELELLRGIAFIFVIIQHTIGGYSIDSKAPFINVVILKIIYTISVPSVPIFIFISAVVLFYTYSSETEIKMFYVKRIVTVLLPYISISLIYVIYEHKKIDNLFFSLFYGSTEYHLWFMGTILRIYLMFPLILFILNRFKNKSKIINVFFVLLYLVFSFILIKNKDSIDNYVACLFTTKSDYHWKEFMSYSPIYLSIYFLLGYYFITYYEKVINFLFKNKKVISIFFIAIFIPRYLILMGNRIDIHFNNYIQTAVIMFFNIDSILFWYIVSEYMIEIKSKIAKLLRFISYYSFGAYLLHVLVLNVLAGIFYSYYHLTNNYIFPSVTLCILTIIITPVICHIVSNIPFSKYIFGVTKYKKY